MNKNYIPPEQEEICYRILLPNGDFYSRNKNCRKFGDLLENTNEIAQLMDKMPEARLIRCYLRDLNEIKIIKHDEIQIGDVVKYVENGIATIHEIKRASINMVKNHPYKVIHIKERQHRLYFMVSGAWGWHRSTLFEKVY